MQWQIGIAHSDILSVCAKVNNAREFLPQGKATAELPIGLLPVEPQSRGGRLGAEVSQYSSSLVLFPGSLNLTQFSSHTGDTI